MILSHEERNRFADYLEQEASTNEGLLEQMKKLPGSPLDELIRRRNAEIMACRVVAKMLRSIEDM